MQTVVEGAQCGSPGLKAPQLWKDPKSTLTYLALFVSLLPFQHSTYKNTQNTMLRLDRSQITLTPGEIRDFKERLAQPHAAVANQPYGMRSARKRIVSPVTSPSTIPRLRRGPERSRDEAVVQLRNHHLHSVASSESDDSTDTSNIVQDGMEPFDLSYYRLRAAKTEAHPEYYRTLDSFASSDKPAKLDEHDSLPNHVGIDLGNFEGLSYHHLPVGISDNQEGHYRTGELVDPRDGSARSNSQERLHNHCGMDVGFSDGLSYHHVKAVRLELPSGHPSTREPVNPGRETYSSIQRGPFCHEASAEHNGRIDLASTTVDELVNLFDSQISLQGKLGGHLSGPHNANTVGDSDGSRKLPRRLRFTMLSDPTETSKPQMVIHPRCKSRLGEGKEVLAYSPHRCGLGSSASRSTDDTLVGSFNLPRAQIIEAGPQRGDTKRIRAARGASLTLPANHVVHARHVSLPNLNRQGTLSQSPVELPDMANLSILGSRWAAKTSTTLHAVRGGSSAADELGHDRYIWQSSPLSIGSGQQKLQRSNTELPFLNEPQTSPLQPPTPSSRGSSPYRSFVHEHETPRVEAVHRAPALTRYGYPQTSRAHTRHSSRPPIWIAGATESLEGPSSGVGRPRTDAAERGYDQYRRRPVGGEDQENFDDMERFEEERQAWLMRYQLSAGGVMERTPPREHNFERYLRQ